MAPALKKHHNNQHHVNTKQNPKIVVEEKSTEGSGINTQIHPLWPDLPPNQSELFFECTLFLYSILALTLQYLNLYKTLWWLPNSHWHYSIKFHLIDLHLLSCVGLLLGLRVTKCFWTSMSEYITHGTDVSAYFWILEWGLIKLPMSTAVIASFSSSSIKVLNSYPITSLLALTYPMFVFCFLFYNELLQKTPSKNAAIKRGFLRRFLDFFRNSFPKLPQLIDADQVAHLCSNSGPDIRDEVDVLLADLKLRFKHCLFVAFSTAYLTVYIPCTFTPSHHIFNYYHSMTIFSAALIVDTWWATELAILVALTSFGIYMTYLMPINYFDLLHRSAFHLGFWLQCGREGNLTVKNWTDSDQWPQESLVKYDGFLYLAKKKINASEPTNIYHSMFNMLAGEPLTIVNSMCVFQALLIAVQFLMLIHTTEWQHIVTLVLLLFANYLLLAKVFKDKVVIGRIYHPSVEDQALIRSFMSRIDSMLSEITSFCGHSVQVDMTTGQREFGLLYTIDPISRMIALIHFPFGNAAHPQGIKLIPGSSVTSVARLCEDDGHYRPCTEEMARWMDDLFKNKTKDGKLTDDEKVKNRDRLVSWFTKCRVPFTENADGSVQIFDLVRISSPFTIDDCQCSNELVLGKVRSMIESMPVDFQT